LRPNASVQITWPIVIGASCMAARSSSSPAASFNASADPLRIARSGFAAATMTSVCASRCPAARAAMTTSPMRASPSPWPRSSGGGRHHTLE